LFYIQVINPITSTDYLNTRKILPERGKIFDQNGATLVTNEVQYQLYLEPKKITDEEILKIQIARHLQIDEASVEAKIDKSKDWIAFYSGISKEKKEAIESLALPGIGFTQMQTRFYPEGSSSAHLLGFVGKNQEGDDIGYFGIEGYYDKDLSGFPGLIRSEKDLIGRPIFLGTQEKIEPENGRDLVLTIDKSVQDIIKRKLIEGIDLYKAKEGCVIVANPQTLAIIGLICIPDFVLEKYYSFDESYFKNQAISSLYEPGSTFKPLIMAAALEEKVVKPSTIFEEKGPIEIGKYRIKTWDNTYKGKVTMTNILEKSSNVGMVYVGQKLGNDKLLSYIKKFGFGEQTGIDLQGEVAGYIKDKTEWYPIDYATATFGQGIAVSPIQMVRAFSSLINGGNLMVPQVVNKLVGSKREQVIKPVLSRKVISKHTSNQIKDMLVSTIEKGETKYLKPDGYTIGGKTGTAQIALQGTYDSSKTIASFIGFSPIKNPKFLALVILKEPSSSQWGSETAAPLFFKIAKDLIVYYNIAPEQ